MKRWDTTEVGGSTMRVYIASAEGAREVPAVLIAQHGPGVDRFIEDRVEALAAEGFLAAAPDLYHRQPADGADMMARIGRLRDAEIVADMKIMDTGGMETEMGALSVGMPADLSVIRMIEGDWALVDSERVTHKATRLLHPEFAVRVGKIHRADSPLLPEFEAIAA